MALEKIQFRNRFNNLPEKYWFKGKGKTFCYMQSPEVKITLKNEKLVVEVIVVRIDCSD